MSALSADVDFFNTNQLLPQCAPFTLQMIRVSTIEHSRYIDHEKLLRILHSLHSELSGLGSIM
ncbi:hypothetical protein CX029_14415 [Vibrio cholerae]|nr:hypothetical protein [Vibrio cholerae]PAR93200.1 hypothetical protein CGT82_13375 [Vibrio cholerae]RJL27649.1 hypothetical protein D5R89_01215 [Vibrio cholerae]